MPKQGDHVFNDLETAIPAPLESVQGLSSDQQQGSHFVDDYLLHTKTIIRQTAADELWRSSRGFTAGDGDEEDVLKELRKLRSRVPELPNVESAVLRSVHDANATNFGTQRSQYELDFYGCLTDLLSSVATGGDSNLRFMLTAHIGYQRMINAAFDPAAAMVVIAKSAFTDNSIAERSTQKLIATLGQASVKNDVMLGAQAFDTFPIHKSGDTKEAADRMNNTLHHREWIKGQGQAFLRVMRAELTAREVRGISQNDRRESAGYMLYLVNEKMSQLASGRRF